MLGDSPRVVRSSGWCTIFFIFSRVMFLSRALESTIGDCSRRQPKLKISANAGLLTPGNGAFIGVNRARDKPRAVEFCIENRAITHYHIVFYQPDIHRPRGTVLCLELCCSFHHFLLVVALYRAGQSAVHCLCCSISHIILPTNFELLSCITVPIAPFCVCRV